MLHTYLVNTSEGTMIVKDESENDAFWQALFSFDYPENVRIISITDLDLINTCTMV